jgi:hypothetical protein
MSCVLVRHRAEEKCAILLLGDTQPQVKHVYILIILHTSRTGQPVHFAQAITMRALAIQGQVYNAAIQIYQSVQEG